MSSATLFTRDAREVPFLHNQLKKLLVLADNASQNLTIKEDDDGGFMAIQFLYKQIHHAESVLRLVPRRDAGLIARTMIDGMYQLQWAFLALEERAKRWRSFSVIHDWRLIQGRLRAGVPVDDDAVRKVATMLEALGNMHRLMKPKASSPDPYNKRWHNITLSDMADAVGRELYDGPYAELSDWEHWGVSGVGDSIVREGDRLVVDSNSDRITGVSLLSAFQCLFQTLALANHHLSLNITDVIQNLGADFRNTIDSFYEK